MDHRRKMKCVLIFVCFLCFKTVCSGPVPETEQSCSLTIWNGNTDVTRQRIDVLEGNTINLICDARCTNGHYTPVIRWINPNSKLIWDIPGRLFTAPMLSHRLQSLYIQDISSEDAGNYECHGWTGKWTSTTVEINIETEANEDLG